jgi:hypothetical protein
VVIAVSTDTHGFCKPLQQYVRFAALSVMMKPLQCCAQPVMCCTYTVMQSSICPYTRRWNEGEARAVLALVERLVCAGVAPEHIGVITPYSAQVSGRGHHHSVHELGHELVHTPG